MYSTHQEGLLDYNRHLGTVDKLNTVKTKISYSFSNANSVLPFIFQGVWEQRRLQMRKMLT